MKFLSATTTVLLSVSAVLADFLPQLANRAPTQADVKERIAPPANATLFDVWYAKGNRIYQCNPELTGFLHWYNVQTHAFLYATNGEEAPFDKPGREIGQIAAAPLNPEQQMANPIDTTPVIYAYTDGSWAGTTRPTATTTKEEDRIERGDGVHLDDHVVPVSKSSTDGYLSHAKYIVRLGSMNGAVPAPEECVRKGLLINQPFTAYFMFYTDNEGLALLNEERAEWERMVREYTPENLAIQHEANEEREHP
ncbi:hypothetical protein BDF20DRAFT_1003520 [Mycotypha africana]|uniref:uncharacterized protein n=1 Tax=Mycotypha africana TaxID=64632 RepID=UPI00230128E9|nr:uncharacterized protein BDF20DRAFT_1003520 [Mycotypha africana]KAI8970297.1 hypothetical protein BDF20DRAFT_1003520 [Mycotypha africana]